MAQDNTGDNAEVKVYPLATADGFFFEDETNEAMAIESHIYENKKEVRRVTLSDGTICIVRQLTGKEMGTDVTRLIGKDQDNYQYALVSVATKFNDQGRTLEEIKDMLGKDYLKLQIACAQINF